LGVVTNDKLQTKLLAIDQQVDDEFGQTKAEDLMLDSPPPPLKYGGSLEELDPTADDDPFGDAPLADENQFGN